MAPFRAPNEAQPPDYCFTFLSEALVECEQSLTLTQVAAEGRLADNRDEERRDGDDKFSLDMYWNRQKALLLRLYMEENQPLPVVRAVMHARYGFQASAKMYKDRFAKWGWKKNQAKSSAVQLSPFPARIARTRRALEIPRGLRSPDTSRSLEMAIFETRRLIEGHIGPDTWTHTMFTLSPAPRLGYLPDLYTPDICMLYAIHQVRQQDIVSAFTAIGQIFSALPITIHTRHLKSVSGLWLLYRKVLDICIMVGDIDVQLLRMMMLFQAQFSLVPQSSRFSAFGCFSRLLSSLAQMYRRSPDLLDEIFRRGYTTVARTLEEQLGPCHPTVLQAWGNLAWYWSLSKAAMQRVTASYTHVLKGAEAAYGSSHAIYVCMLCDFAILVHHAEQQTELGLNLAEDLWRCVRTYVVTTPPESGSPMLRVAAMAAVLKARTTRPEKHQRISIVIQELCDLVLSWLASSQADDVAMVAVMLQADKAFLIEACNNAGVTRLHPKQLNFLRPRCFDLEREEKQQFS